MDPQAYYLLEKCAELEARLAEQAKETKDLKEDLEGAEGYAKSAKEERDALRKEIENLKKEKKQNELLVCTGIAIRVRYLEQAKGQAGMAPQGFNPVFVQRGNDFAHWGMGEVDAALFRSDHLSAQQKLQLNGIFKHLYEARREMYPELPHKFRQALDYKATIASLVSLNDNLTSLKDRQAAGDCMDLIRKKYEELSVEEFEKNPDVTRSLERLANFADDIVQKSRVRAAHPAASAYLDTQYNTRRPGQMDKNARRQQRGGQQGRGYGGGAAGGSSTAY